MPEQSDESESDDEDGANVMAERICADGDVSWQERCRMFGFDVPVSDLESSDNEPHSDEEKADEEFHLGEWPLTPGAPNGQ